MTKVWFIAAAAVCLLLSMQRVAEGSVHEYNNVGLAQKGNAYMLYGGSEGLYATSANAQGSGVANGKSYIRQVHGPYYVDLGHFPRINGRISIVSQLLFLVCIMIYILIFMPVYANFFCKIFHDTCHLYKICSVNQDSSVL